MFSKFVLGLRTAHKVLTTVLAVISAVLSSLSQLGHEHGEEALARV